MPVPRADCPWNPNPDNRVTNEIDQPCRLCPRCCGAERSAGVRGYCGAGALPRLYRYGAHFGEEPPLSGTRGSGTLFFSHCTLRCIYCQNYPWSQECRGEDLTVEQLREVLEELARQRCHNWNLVSPTPWLPQIRAAVRPLFERDIRLPFVYNTSGFESPKTLCAYRDLINIALTDLRYSRSETADEASDCGGYVDVARLSLKWFWDELGPLQFDDEGCARQGTICRLLVLPGHADEAVENLAWIAGHIGTDIHVSVMSQYTPVHTAMSLDGWNRRVTAAEYRRVTEAAEALGFENGWIQPYEAAETRELLGCEMSAGAGTVATRGSDYERS